MALGRDALGLAIDRYRRVVLTSEFRWMTEEEAFFVLLLHPFECPVRVCTCDSVRRFLGEAGSDERERRVQV